jgi:hypothetical protein
MRSGDRTQPPGAGPGSTVRAFVAVSGAGPSAIDAFRNGGSAGRPVHKIDLRLPRSLSVSSPVDTQEPVREAEHGIRFPERVRRPVSNLPPPLAWSRVKLSRHEDEIELVICEIQGHSVIRQADELLLALRDVFGWWGSAVPGRKIRSVTPEPEPCQGGHVLRSECCGNGYRACNRGNEYAREDGTHCPVPYGSIACATTPYTQ